MTRRAGNARTPGDATRILCATDLLPRSDAALERAAILADSLDASLHVLHVVAPSQSDNAIEHQLERAIASMKARVTAPRWKFSVNPQAEVTVGSPTQRIVKAMQETGAGLVVLGPHRRRGVREALTGSIAEKVLSTRKVPLLIVQQEPRGPYRNIVLALDLSPVSAAAVRAAESLLMLPQVSSIALHACQPPYEGRLAFAGVGTETLDAYGAEWARRGEMAVRDFLKEHSADFTRYRVVVAKGRPATAVLDATRRVRADLLVMGTHGRSRLGRILLGSVATEVLHSVGCDVLIVPDGEMRPVRRQRSAARKRGRSSSTQRMVTAA